MKKIIIISGLLLTCTTSIFAQKYLTRTAKVSFDATAPNSPEKIEAINNEVANILDASSGDVVFQVLVKSFKFERALMQEHFNEKYMESDKYPKSEFKGNIKNNSDINYTKDGTYNATVTGKLTMHGVTQSVNTSGTVAVKGNSVTLNAKFTVKLADYKIAIPGVVADKVGKEAIINIESSLTKK